LKPELCGETHRNVQLFYARIEEAVAKTSEYLSPKVVAIAEQIVKVFINSFVNAATLLSQTLERHKTSGKI